MVQVHIPPSWRDLTGGSELVEVEAASVRQVFTLLDERFPGIRERACESDRLKPGLAVAVNGTVSSQGLIQRLAPGAEVHFLPAIGGG
jgi:molybdopterin converting factor small subunit